MDGLERPRGLGREHSPPLSQLSSLSFSPSFTSRYLVVLFSYPLSYFILRAPVPYDRPTYFSDILETLHRPLRASTSLASPRVPDLGKMSTQDATMATMAQTIADMSKILTDLRAEVAMRPASNPLDALLGAPANPLGFPPGANGVYPVLSTPLLHPHLLPDVIAQISKFEFPPTHLGRLRKTASVTPQAPLLLVTGEHGEARLIPAEPVPGATILLREVPDILCFTEAFLVFISVLQNECRGLPIAQSLSAYLGNVVALSKVYSWPTVLDYHVAFVQLRAADPFFSPVNWLRSDPHLHTLHLLMPSIPSTLRNGVPAPAVVPVVPEHTYAKQNRNEVCYIWNSASGCGGTAVGCIRRHACRKCAGPHTYANCQAVVPAAVGAASAST
ncbi:hypothetical protein C8J57DRAFT_1590363 [Mycena rebaudengoi]|nr:hypothetical protein C8J57DRAFT_1590363 [Mycena rebaudengoi]